MARSKVRKKRNHTAPTNVSLPILHPHAAGIDVGSRSHYVCVGKGLSYVRKFGVFTDDLHQLASYLKEHHIVNVAMESTGFYWKNLFLILQSYGFKVILVNAQHVKNVRGRKTDVKDCQWIQRLHSCGLLSASFQPNAFSEHLRTLTRHRTRLLNGAAQYSNKMQKALTLMNLQLPIVLRDITGKSGLTIIKAILAGHKDAKYLASLADPRVQTDKETIARALTGVWHEQYLFELRQCFDFYEFHQAKIAECDAQIEQLLQKEVAKLDKPKEDASYHPSKKKA